LRDASYETIRRCALALDGSLALGGPALLLLERVCMPLDGRGHQILRIESVPDFIERS
jgi:hypothetical protein